MKANSVVFWKKIHKLIRRIAFVFPVLVILFLIGCTRTQNISGSMPEASPFTSTQSSTINIIQTYSTITPEPDTTKMPDLSVTGTQTITLSPVPLTFDPTYLIFDTETPTPTLDPDLFLLRIVSPGPMSKVISPVELVLHIAPEYTGITRIELIGEDGAVIYAKVLRTYSNLGYYTRLTQKIDYEIRGAAEIARLQISTFDSNGGIQALSSVRLLLQDVGENQFFQMSEVIRDRLSLRFPVDGDLVTGGVLSVQGEFQPMNNLPLVLELTDADGSVLGSRLIQLSASDGTYQRFMTDIPYQVQKKTQARLVIHQSDDRIDGLSYLFSRKLFLAP